jgi:transposase
VASERDEAKRARFRAQVTPLASDRFIFVDETSTHTAMTRRYARAPRGERAYGSVPRNHGPNLSLIGALGLRGMVATMSVEGAIDTDAFEAFVEQVLVPALQPGDLVLLDNLKVHRVSNIQQAVSAVGGDVIFLPPYSPDFSPIEPCWSKRKTFLRGYAARTQALLETALTKVLLTLSPDDIRNWFRHCGYEVAPE